LCTVIILFPLLMDIPEFLNPLLTAHCNYTYNLDDDVT
jgi:hypothetical protein